MESQALLLPAPANRFERYAAWLVLSGLATAAVSWTAFQIQQEGFAPAAVFPLGVGAALGSLLSAISRKFMVPRRRAAVAAAIAWGLLAVVGQDYIGHRRHLREYDSELGAPRAARGSRAGLRRAPSDVSRIRKRSSSSRPVWWCLEALLTAVAAATSASYGVGRRKISTSNEA